MRLDLLLVSKGLFESREKAKYSIVKGLVLVNNKAIIKPSFECLETDSIIINQTETSYVSRGGLKLEKAISSFKISLKDKIVLDIGASTGGFTDCALQNGASKVYAIDVGTDQLVDKIKKNPKVISKEQSNFRYLSPSDLDNTKFDYILSDVSFISLKFIFDNVLPFTKNDTGLIFLIKPQFELYEEAIKHKGIISSKLDHQKAINLVISYANKQGFYLDELTYSPILGKKKNMEFLALFKQSSSNEPNVEEIVRYGHEQLFRK